jgi:hypothetical protein
MGVQFHLRSARLPLLADSWASPACEFEGLVRLRWVLSVGPRHLCARHYRGSLVVPSVSGLTEASLVTTPALRGWVKRDLCEI